MARGRKSGQRAPRSGLNNITGNSFQVDPFEVRNVEESIRSVETAEMPVSNLVSEQVTSTAPNINQGQGIASDCVGQGVTFDFSMQNSRATNSLPGPPSNPPILSTPIAQSLQGTEQELRQNCVSEPTHSQSMAPPLILRNPHYNPGTTTGLAETPIARSGPATRSMTARQYDRQPEGPRYQAFGEPSYTSSRRSTGTFPARAPPPVQVSEAHISASYSTHNMGCPPVYTMANPVFNATTQGTGYNSAHPFVSSQVTAPSIHSAAQFMPHNSQAPFVSQLYPTGVAPVNFSATSVSQPTRYSMPVFHTQAVPGSTPNITQGSAANYGPIASNRGQPFHDQTIGAGSDPNYPRNLFPGDQYTPQQNGYGQSGYPQQQPLNYTSYGPPNIINKPNYHHLKGKDMEVPKYKGFNDPRTPYDFLLELDKFQTILAYSDDDMLYRVIPMALHGEAYTWFRSELIPFTSFHEFKLRLRKEYQPVGYIEDLNREIDKRTQGPNEPLTSYIRVMRDYYERL